MRHLGHRIRLLPVVPVLKLGSMQLNSYQGIAKNPDHLNQKLTVKQSRREEVIFINQFHMHIILGFGTETFLKSPFHRGAFSKDFVRISIGKQNKGSTRKLTSYRQYTFLNNRRPRGTVSCRQYIRSLNSLSLCADIEQKRDFYGNFYTKTFLRSLHTSFLL